MMDCVCVRLDSDDMAMTMNVMSHVDVFEQESTVCWTPRDPLAFWLRFGYARVRLPDKAGARFDCGVADLTWGAHRGHPRSGEMLKTKRATGLYADMDLTGVVSTLESHWVVLDAELSEIRKDFGTLRALTRKHGDFWSRPMAQLKKLRTQKENLLKECAALPAAQPCDQQPCGMRLC